MIDHLGITVTDLERSALFYDEVLAVLGHRELYQQIADAPTSSAVRGCGVAAG